MCWVAALQFQQDGEMLTPVVSPNSPSAWCTGQGQDMQGVCQCSAEEHPWLMGTLNCTPEQGVGLAEDMLPADRAPASLRSRAPSSWQGWLPPPA